MFDFLGDIPGIFANDKVSPKHAEHVFAPVSPSSCGICSIVDSLSIDSIVNPHLNDDPGAIIAFPDET
jgi:hypothetical protein